MNAEDSVWDSATMGDKEEYESWFDERQRDFELVQEADGDIKALENKK